MNEFVEDRLRACQFAQSSVGVVCADVKTMDTCVVDTCNQACCPHPAGSDVSILLHVQVGRGGIFPGRERERSVWGTPGPWAASKRAVCLCCCAFSSCSFARVFLFVVLLCLRPVAHTTRQRGNRADCY